MHHQSGRRFARGFRPLGLILLLAAVAACPAAAHCAENAASQLEISAGLRRVVKVGRWAPITVKTGDATIESVQVESIDPAGKLVRFPLRKVDATSGSKTVFRGLFQVGKLEATAALRVAHKDGRVRVEKLGGGKTDDPESPLEPVSRQSVFVVVTLGKPAGFSQLAGEEEESDTAAESNAKTSRAGKSLRTIELPEADAFPRTLHGLDAVNAVVVSGQYPLNAKQDAALRLWVGGGGHLVVCRGTELEPFLNASRKSDEPQRAEATSNDALLAAWLPVTIRRQLRLRAQDLAALKDFSQQKIPIISSGRIPSAQVDDPRRTPDAAGRVLAGGGDQPNLIVRVPYGFGMVTFCAVDFHRPPVSTWVGVNSLGRQILLPTMEAVADEKANGGQRVSGTGLSDLSTQLHAMQDHFPQVRRAGTWQTMLMVLLYIVVIGPLDYLIVHRVLKRPHLTWVTFPVLVALVTWWAIGNAETRNGRELRLNQLCVVDIDATRPKSPPSESSGQPVIVRSWFTLYSPQTRRYSLAVEPNGVPSKPLAGEVAWSGFPEDVYGGMYRTGGLEIGRLSYSIEPDRMQIDNLPLRLWSAQTIAGTQRYRRPGAVGGRLTLTETGRLTGTIEHNLGGPISNWIIVYGQKLYRAEKANAAEGIRTIAPGTRWSLARPGIVQHNTEDELKSMRFAEDEKEPASGRYIQRGYDPYSGDFDEYLRVLTLHAQLRGREYTGLANVPLADMDFSRLLTLNRAVLIGRLEPPPTKLMELTEGDKRTEIRPTSSHTIVRIVLPVFERTEER